MDVQPAVSPVFDLVISLYAGGEEREELGGTVGLGQLRCRARFMSALPLYPQADID
jgi:hypothetical protein